MFGHVEITWRLLVPLPALDRAGECGTDRDVAGEREAAVIVVWLLLLRFDILGHRGRSIEAVDNLHQEARHAPADDYHGDHNDLPGNQVAHASGTMLLPATV